jgi:hypothetical protein
LLSEGFRESRTAQEASNTIVVGIAAGCGDVLQGTLRSSTDLLGVQRLFEDGNGAEAEALVTRLRTEETQDNHDRNAGCARILIELGKEKSAVRIRQDNIEDDERDIGHRKRVLRAGSRRNAADLDSLRGQRGPYELSGLRVVVDDKDYCRIGARSRFVGHARPYRFESKMLRSQPWKFVRIIP